jgi:hypothetical protein
LVIKNTKRNKISKSTNTYPHPKKATQYIGPTLMSNFNNRNNQDL